MFRPARIWASAADSGGDQYTGIVIENTVRARPGMHEHTTYQVGLPFPYARTRHGRASREGLNPTNPTPPGVGDEMYDESPMAKPVKRVVGL